ncbi:MAG: hypothetical protein NVSMB65_13670 [Chloroflexota bacterium]
MARAGRGSHGVRAELHMEQAGALLDDAGLQRMVRQMTPAQTEVLKLLQDNNGICHFARVKQHVFGRREPQTAIKGLHTRGLVTVTHSLGDWGCPEIKYVRVTPQGRQVLRILDGM